MRAERVQCPTVPEAEPETWTNAKVYGNQFFISGMTARDPAGNPPPVGMYDQAKRVFQKLRDLTEAAGANVNDIVQLNVFVTDMNQRKEVWRARKEFFTGDFPCSTLVQVSALAMPGLLVEINAVGFIGSSK